MSGLDRLKTFDRVLIDMNTQCDFLLPKGAVPVTNRVKVLPNIRKIMNWGRIERVPVISSLECHRPDEHSNGLPPYCVDRTRGQRKLPFTLLPHRIVLHGDNTLDLPHDPFRRYRQVIFTKRDLDFLSNPKADRLINSLHASRIIVFGVLAENCVKAAVLSLIVRQRRPIVITDACGTWCASDAQHSFRQMEAKGAILATTEELLSGVADARLQATKPLKRVEEDESESLLPDGNGRYRIPFVDIKPADAVARRGSNGNGKPKRKPSELMPAILAARRKHRSANPRSKPPRDLA